MEDEWTRWFVTAGIPRSVAANYSKIFVRNRIKKSLVRDLDKATLAELGVVAVGDQLAILRAARSVNASASGEDSSTHAVKQQPVKPKARITAPEDVNTLVVPAGPRRRGVLPPDRDEIYHIRMPVGATEKTRKILQVSEALRREGLHTRGTNGVRKGGRSVSPVSRDPEAQKLARQRRFQQLNQVSSTTSEANDRLGVQGMISDRLSRVHGGRVTKRLVSAQTHSQGVAQRLTTRPIALSTATTVVTTGHPAARLLKGGNIRVKLANETLVANSRRPQVVLQTGGRQQGGSRLQTRVQGIPRQRPVVTKRAQPVQYVTANEEYEEVYEDDGGEDELMEEVYEDELDDGFEEVEYVTAPTSSRGASRGASVFQRLSTGF